MNGDSFERSETYTWARRNGLHEPYDFAIRNEELWGDRVALRGAARSRERKRLMEQERRIEEELAEIGRKLQMVRDQLKRNEDDFYDA